MMNKMVSVSIHPLTKPELDVFLSDLESYVDDTDGLRPFLVKFQADVVRGIAKTDTDAELVWHGYKLGAIFAANNGKSFWKSIHDGFRKLADETKRKTVARKNEELVKQYLDQKSQVGELKARQALRKERGLSLTQINNILHAAGARTKKAKS